MSKFAPNALLSSARTAAVKKRRPFQLNCSWTYIPSVRFSMKSSLPEVIAAPLTVVTAGVGKSLPEDPEIWSSLR